MKKFKSIDWSSVLTILKCCLIGIVATLLGVLAFAFVLKFADFPSKFISYINDLIKILSLFVVMILIKKKSDGNLMVKAIFAGVVYSLLTFFIFSALNGGITFNASIFYDLLFAVISSIIITIIVSLLSRKAV